MKTNSFAARTSRVAFAKGLDASPGTVHITLPNGKPASILWVTIEGPIGAGKTELTKVLMPRLIEKFGADRVVYVAEPIDELMRSGLFQRYQRDPARWAYEFQTEMFDKRTDYWRAAWDSLCQMLTTTTTCDQDHDHHDGGRKLGIMLSERSILSDTCFMRVQHECGHCDQDTLDRYLSLNAKWRAGLYHGCSPGLIIYCRAGTETDGIVGVCQQRIRSRAREAEEDLVTPEYNRRVLVAHDTLFGTQDGTLVFPATSAQPALSIDVMVMDTTENYRDDPRVALKKSGEVLQAIQLATSVLSGVMPIGGAGPVDGGLLATAPSASPGVGEQSSSQ